MTTKVSCKSLQCSILPFTCACPPLNQLERQRGGRYTSDLDIITTAMVIMPCIFMQHYWHYFFIFKFCLQVCFLGGITLISHTYNTIADSEWVPLATKLIFVIHHVVNAGKLWEFSNVFDALQLCKWNAGKFFIRLEWKVSIHGVDKYQIYVYWSYGISRSLSTDNRKNFHFTQILWINTKYWNFIDSE